MPPIEGAATGPSGTGPRPSERPADASPSADAAVRVDAVLARRPTVDAGLCAAALASLTRARDAERDPAVRGGLNLAISLVMGVKHPIGAPPWDALAEARHRFLEPAAGDRPHG